MEAWFSLQDFPGYSVSSYGRVRNDKFKRVLTVLTNSHGVARVGVWCNGRQIKLSLGKLVAKTFIEVPRHNQKFDAVIHLDGDNLNNHPSNLAWRPFWFANVYSRQFKTVWDDTRPVRDCNTGERYSDAWEVVIRNGLLMRDVIMSAHDQMPIFPTFQVFEWDI